MRHRFISLTLALLATVAQAAAQALTDRYNSQRPVIIVCDKNDPPHSFQDNAGRLVGSYIDMMRAVTERVGVPCKFVLKERASVEGAFEQGRADLILTDGQNYSSPRYVVSKSIISYNRAGLDSITEIHFTGKDRQLIEQMDDEYMRLRQEGVVNAIHSQWAKAGHAPAETAPSLLHVTLITLAVTAILALLILLILWHIRSVTRHSVDLCKIISEAQQMDKYYAMEDSEAAHNLISRHEAILSNPFVAISFYDKNGRLVIQNDAMRQLGDTVDTSQRQPLYNAKGEVTNYLVAIGRPKAAT